MVIPGGGNGNNRGALNPCWQRPRRGEGAGLGDISKDTFEEIWDGDKYNQLRVDHKLGNYPSYCHGCDFLIDDPEVLVYTNHERDLYKMHGTDFDLNDYR